MEIGRGQTERESPPVVQSLEKNETLSDPLLRRRAHVHTHTHMRVHTDAQTHTMEVWHDAAEHRRRIWSFIHTAHEHRCIRHQPAPCCTEGLGVCR